MTRKIVFLLALSVSLFASAQDRDTLRVSILGDSYSTFNGWLSPRSNAVWYFEEGHPYSNEKNDVKQVEQTWWYQVIEDCGYKLEKNNSFSGATVCQTGYNKVDYSDRSFVTRAFNLGHPDIILVCGATNDDWSGAPIGEYKWGEWTNDDLFSFRPAMAKMCHELKTLYPEARTLFMLNSELREDINESVHTVCSHYNIECVDLHDIDKQADHPSRAGMKAIAEQVEERLKTTPRWCDSSNWYDDGRQVDEGLADVFYLVSTDITAARDADGRPRYIATITDDDRAAITPEMAKVAKDMGDSLNFFSPYYRQFTLEALDLGPDACRDTVHMVLEDVWEAFSFYLEHLNNGRPFALAGFSQGAMYIPELIGRMDDAQYSRMSGAYMMGYRLSADDLKRPHLRAASGADDIGAVISFNSAASREDFWPFVNEGAVTCINPLNWKTDSTPASMVYYGDSLTFHIDTELNTIIVDGTDPAKFNFPMLERYCRKGNLHHWDRKFYADAIRANILHRSELLRGSSTSE